MKGDTEKEEARNTDRAACQRECTCYVQISLHEKGFWQADYFLTPESEAPEWFCTGKIGDSPAYVVSTASAKYPGVRFTFPDEEHECAECGVVEDVIDVNGEYLCAECANLCLYG